MNGRSSHVRIYEPDHALRAGLRVWAEMVRELIDARELIWRFLVRDFSARYKQTVLGWVWAVVPVLATVLVFTFMNRNRLLHMADCDIPYPLYVLLGMTVWYLFATGVANATNSLVSAGAMIAKINFPRETLVLASFGQAFVEFGVRLVLVALFFAWYRIVPSWTIVFVPLVVLPLLLLAIGMGMVLSLVNGVFRDVGNSIQMILMFLLFVTPVVYPPPTQWPFVLVNTANPISPLLAAVKDLAIGGSLSDPWGLIASSLFSLLVCLVAWRLFHLAEPRIAERI